MIWVFIALVLLFIGPLLAGESPLQNPLFWLMALIVGVHYLAFRREARDPFTRPVTTPEYWAADKEAPALSFSSSSKADDMLYGVRDWKDGDGPEEIAYARCSLAGRGDDYLRSLLVTASLRNDDAGRTVAAAARWLLQGNGRG